MRHNSKQVRKRPPGCIAKHQFLRRRKMDSFELHNAYSSQRRRPSQRRELVTFWVADLVNVTNSQRFGLRTYSTSRTRRALGLRERWHCAPDLPLWLSNFLPIDYLNDPNKNPLFRYYFLSKKWGGSYLGHWGKVFQLKILKKILILLRFFN